MSPPASRSTFAPGCRPPAPRIFSVMSALAQQHGAVNLGQGFPDYAIDPALIDLVTAAMRAGHNQYPLIARRAWRCARRSPARSCGSTAAATTPSTRSPSPPARRRRSSPTIGALAHPGDEVIVFEPAYDSYIPAVRLAGATPVPLPLTVPGYRIDWAARAPRDHAAHADDHRQHAEQPGHERARRRRTARELAALTRGTDIVDRQRRGLRAHGLRRRRGTRASRAHAELAARSVVIGSFGKTFHATGWKVGYALAPRDDHRRDPARAPVHRVHRQQPDAARARASSCASPRATRRCRSSSRASATCCARRWPTPPLELLPCAGSYFQLARYDRVSDEPAAEFAQRLVREVGVATIPLSAFYHDGTDHRVIRFCFAKRDETLLAAAERLRRLRA